MAQVRNNKNPMQDRYKRHLILAIVFLSLTFLSMICHVTLGPALSFHFIFVITFMVFGIIGGYNFNKARILGSGIRGKKKTLGFVTGLPDSYRVVTNSSVTYEGKTSRLDTVIIGTNGVFIIQTNNRNGTIYGSLGDRELTQHKVGQKGNPYDTTFYSPMKQVSTHVFRLSKVLKENGIHSWVQGIVYFSNPNADIQVRGDYNSVPVFDTYTRDDMSEFITTFNKNKNPLTNEQIEKTAKLLA